MKPIGIFEACHGRLAMRLQRLSVIAFVLAATVTPAAAQIPIACGETKSGTVSPGGMVTYGFTGEAGDVVWLSVVTTGGVLFTAQATLFNPAMNPIGSTTSSLELTLPVGGTYTVRITDSFGADSGTYEVGLEWLAPLTKQCAGTWEAISCGVPKTGKTLVHAGQDLYRFTGEAGDVVWLSVVTTGGVLFTAQATLFNPAMNAIGSTTSSWELTLPVSGTYTVRIRNASATTSGTYEVGLEWLAPLTKQCAGTWEAMPCDTPVPKSLPRAAQDLYRFSAAAADVVLLRLTTTGGIAFTASATLFDQSMSQAGATTGTLQVTLPTTGLYTIRVKDAFGADVGTYNLELEWVSPVAPCPLQASLTIDGGISSTKPQGDTFQFAGTGFTPHGQVSRHVNGPDGETELAPVLSADADGALTWTFTPTCSKKGTYTIWAVDVTTGQQTNNVTEVITENPACGLLTLRFPLTDYTSTSAPMSSAFDHAMGNPYSRNNVVTAFDGTRTERSFGPGTLTALPGNQQIELKWTGSVGGVLYRLVGKQSKAAPVIGRLCDPGPGESVLYEGTETSFLHVLLTNDTKYGYRLCTMSADGSIHAGLSVTAIPSPTATKKKKGTDECDTFSKSDGSLIAISSGTYVGVTGCGKGNYLAYDGHAGIDYAVPYGTPVHASIGGKVSYVTAAGSVSKPAKYHTLVIAAQDGSGYQVLYLHLSSYLVPSTGAVKVRLSGGNIVDCFECPQEGDLVLPGDLIGYVGNYQGGWGKVSPHLHVEVVKDGVVVDPYGWRGAEADPYIKGENKTLWEDLPPPASSGGTAAEMLPAKGGSTERQH